MAKYRNIDKSIDISIKESAVTKETERIRDSIAETVRGLRKARRWSQAELAGRLGISQSRLSELERGGGSFTAEQLLVLLQLFNVTPSDFVKTKPADEHAALQNALARHGAVHLHESEAVLPTGELDVAHAIRSALLAGVPRLITALAPVLVLHIDGINLARLRATLADGGFERRFAWLIENVLSAIRQELTKSPPRTWSRRYNRAAVVLANELEAARANLRADAVPDILDRDIRSPKTRRLVEESASAISRSWKIISALQPADFAQALGASRADD